MIAARNAVFRNIQMLFSERRIRATLFMLSLALHTVVFGALFFQYGEQGFYLSVGDSLDGNDGQHYMVIAKNIVEGHGYSRFVDAPYELDALRTPLLPLYLVPFFFVGGLPLLWLAILVMNIFLAVAPVVLYGLARLFLSHVYAVCAALYLVLDPLFLYRSQLAEPDALFAVLVLCAIYLYALYWNSSIRSYLLMASCTLGLAILAKPSALYIAAILFASHIVITACFKRQHWRTEAKHLILGILVMAAVISPWLIRNHSAWGVWSISSITGFNLYEFYTTNLRLPDEFVPETILESSREPTRYLPNQEFFTDVAISRIQHAPLSYAKEQFMGTLRNLFVSELPVIYYYGHSGILPFRYNPESTVALVHNAPKLLWFLCMALLYVLVAIGWLIALKKDRATCVAFTICIVLFAYLIVSCGPYVDAKYRMPAMPLLVIMALYGLAAIETRIEKSKIPVRSRGA